MRTLSRLALPAVSALFLGVLPALPAAAPAHVHGSAVASPGWLTRLNLWRANAGLPLLTENTTWDAGDYDHALYMVKNDLVTHYETAGTPYYTTDGDTAARNSNIYVSSSTSTADETAIDWWMAAPFHELGMMDPRLSSTGFGSYRQVKSGWDMGAAVDVLRGNPFTGGSYPVYFPGNGTSEPLTTYGGNEFPDPLQACPGYAAPTGLPISIQVGGNLATTAGAVSTFTGNGAPLEHCVIDSHSPSVGSNLTYRGAVVLIPRQPLQTGVRYVVGLTVNSIPYTWTFTVGTFNSCASVALNAAPLSPAVAGSSVTLTAQTSWCPNPSPLYEYWILPPGAAAWQLAQAYSTSAILSWNTAGLAAGTYGVAVWARDASSTGAFGNSAGRWDTYSSSQYTLSASQSTTACSGVSLGATPASAAPGATVSFTAHASGCPNPVYQFWVLGPGATAWQVGQAYSTSATYNWNTSGLAAGSYGINVWARDSSDAGSSGNTTGRWDAYASTRYSLVSCSAVSFSSIPASAAPGATVTFSAVAAGCASPLYEFWLLPPGGTAWQLAQAYSTSATLSWATAGLVPGAYGLSVWARDANSTGASGNGVGRWDAYASGRYTLSSCSAVSLSASPASAVTGATVTLSAHATGCASPVYQFWVLVPGGAAWQMVQAYSAASTAAWSTSGLAPGTYGIAVWVRDAGSGGASGNSIGRWDAASSGQYRLS